MISRPPSPVPQPQPRHTHVTPSPCVGAVCTTKHAPHSHSSCGMVGGTCGGPPPAYSPHRHHSIHPLGCGISPGYHHDAYMGLNTMPMMMHAPIQYGQTTMVPVHGHSYSNQGFVNHRGPGELHISKYTTALQHVAVFRHQLPLQNRHQYAVSPKTNISSVWVASLVSLFC